MAPPTTSDLIFSAQANHNFSKTLGEIKRHTLSVHNRLQSILEDAAFVQAVKEAYGRPLIANERCGSWYINPQEKDGSAYFKSTDGHTGVWSFSTRRLNLHLLQIIGQHDGCIIVDSTRRGKRMPDALSKTIPIWCSVLNRALFPDRPTCHNLYTPPQVVSSSEHSQITTRIDEFVKSLKALQLDLAALKKVLPKPIRPVWITPESNLSETTEIYEDFHPVICCTASRRVPGGEVSEGGYIQGSGDDTENWAFGLTPTVFWANKQVLLDSPESEVPDLIHDLCSASPPKAQSLDLASIKPTECLFVTTSHDLDILPGEGQIVIHLSPDVAEADKWIISPTKMLVGIGPHKIGSKGLRTALPHIVDFVTTRLHKQAFGSTPFKIVAACPSGKDHSVGVALALLCLLFDDQGHLGEPAGIGAVKEIDKLFIKRRLGWIMTCMPDANPTRATLQSVNSYLIDRPS